MTVLKETDWLDGDDFPTLEGVWQAIKASGGVRCIYCGAEQPNDMKWPCFAIELERKDDGQSSGDIEFRACPKHEGLMDSLMDKLGAA